jgi:hypothetical protein
MHSVTHMVSGSGLFSLFEKLHEDHNVIKIEHERVGVNYQVTIHYAIMDIALQRAALATRIERFVEEAKDLAQYRS